VGPILKRIAGTYKGTAETYKEPTETHKGAAETYKGTAETYKEPTETHKEPTETHKGAESTFNVGDKVATGSINGQIESIVEDGFTVKYKDGKNTRVKRFKADQLTKVGGTRRRRKSRKRIR
jgi:preprotein translocase subunit YajC